MNYSYSNFNQNLISPLKMKLYLLKISAFENTRIYELTERRFRQIIFFLYLFILFLKRCYDDSFKNRSFIGTGSAGSPG